MRTRTSLDLTQCKRVLCRSVLNVFLAKYWIMSNRSWLKQYIYHTPIAEASHMSRSVILTFNPCSTKSELHKVIILQLLLMEKYKGPDLGDLNGSRYGPVVILQQIVYQSCFFVY